MLKARSYAKLNLYLFIRGKREDGYHLIESEFQTIGLYDEIYIKPAKEFILECSGEKVPCDERNFVYKAFSLFKKTTGIEGEVKITLRKNIPKGRGLGGGSSNAAITLLLLNRLAGQILNEREISELASRIGADVPFFLKGGRAKVSGIGEILKPMDDFEGYAVVVDPGFEISTAEAYKEYDRLAKEGFDFSIYKNHLLPAAISLRPELSVLVEMGMDMTGSGSAFFKIFSHREQAMAFYGKIQRWRKWVIPLISSSEYRKFSFGE